MIYITRNSNQYCYGVNHWCIDEESELAKVRKTDSPGSEVYVFTTGNTYILNNSHEWQVKQSGTSPVSRDEVIALIDDKLNAAYITPPELADILT